MAHKLFGRSETISNHGTQQGIVPRFQLQSLELAKMAMYPNAEEHVGNFSDYCLEDFINFYDIHQVIKEKYQVYITGLLDGTFFNIGDVKTQFHDRSVEIEMRKHVKDFFIAGRQLLDNFGKSKFIDDEKLQFNKILVNKKEALEKVRNEVASMGNKPDYGILFKIIDNYRLKVTEPFVKIRAKFEHENYKLEKFIVKEINDGVDITEPKINGENFMVRIDFFYEKILYYLEILIATFFGLYAHHRTKGNMTLFENLTYDYSKLRYRYTILPKIWASNGVKQILKS